MPKSSLRFRTNMSNSSNESWIQPVVDALARGELTLGVPARDALFSTSRGARARRLSRAASMCFMAEQGWEHARARGVAHAGGTGTGAPCDIWVMVAFSLGALRGFSS
jgi:hypothetical protein